VALGRRRRLPWRGQDHGVRGHDAATSAIGRDHAGAVARRHDNGITGFDLTAIGGPAALEIGEVDLLGDREKVPWGTVDDETDRRGVAGKPGDLRCMPQRFSGGRVTAGIDGIGETIELRGESTAFVVGPGAGSAVAAGEYQYCPTCDQNQTATHVASSVRAAARSTLRR
jgi:hypothetical protein